MAQINYRANLSSANFPLTIAKAGRSVIVPGPDQNFDRRVDPASEMANPGIPQAMYMENVLPTPDGFQSVGYTSGGTITPPSGGTITGVLALRPPLVTSTAFGIQYTDAGDDIGDWNISPPLSGGGLYSEVIQTALFGNPSDCYEFRGDETNDPGEQPYMNREYDVSGSSRIRFRTQFSFQSMAQNQVCAIAACCDSTGVGVGAIFNGVGTLLSINLLTGWQTYGNSLVASVPAAAVTATSWYLFELEINVELDTSKTVTATIYDTDLTTVLYTVTANTNFSVGNFFGMIYGETSYDTPAPFYAMNWDNIAVDADGIGFESELDSAILAFRSDNTGRWSHSGVAFENLVPTVPSGFLSPISQDELSSAFVRGVQYIGIKTASTGAMRIYTVSIDSGTGVMALTEVTADINGSLPAPFTVDDVNCIVGSFNYLVLLTKSTAFWSSTTTPTDFNPSLVSGAGYAFVNNLKDNITFAKEHSAGFAIYTSRNAVFAAYTGNSRYPWKFREIQGSGGFSTQTQVSGDTNTPNQIGVTDTGQLQALDPDSATLISKEVSDFFERVTVYDRYSSAGTGSFSLVQNAMQGPVDHFQVYLFLDRYIVCPYGNVVSGAIDAFEYALVYDMQLKRYGKLKTNINFVYCDEDQIFFVEKSTGAISVLNLNIYAVSGSTPIHAGFLLLGKFQYVRAKFMQMETVEFESTPNTSIISVPNRVFVTRLIPTFDGKNFSTPVTLTPVVSDSVGNLVVYNCHNTAKNWCIAVTGAFDLSSMELTFNPHGDF